MYYENKIIDHLLNWIPNLNDIWQCHLIYSVLKCSQFLYFFFFLYFPELAAINYHIYLNKGKSYDYLLLPKINDIKKKKKIKWFETYPGKGRLKYDFIRIKNEKKWINSINIWIQLFYIIHSALPSLPTIWSYLKLLTYVTIFFFYVLFIEQYTKKCITC